MAHESVNSQSISSANIISAYVYEDPYQQRRIREWKRLNIEFLRSLIPPEPKRGKSKPKKK